MLPFFCVPHPPFCLSFPFGQLFSEPGSWFLFLRRRHKFLKTLRKKKKFGGGGANTRDSASQRPAPLLCPWRADGLPTVADWDVRAEPTVQSRMSLLQLASRNFEKWKLKLNKQTHTEVKVASYLLIFMLAGELGSSVWGMGVPFKALGDVRTSCCDTIMSHFEVDQNPRVPDVSTPAVGRHRRFREGKKKRPLCSVATKSIYIWHAISAVCRSEGVWGVWGSL